MTVYVCDVCGHEHTQGARDPFLWPDCPFCVTGTYRPKGAVLGVSTPPVERFRHSMFGFLAFVVAVLGSAGIADALGLLP